MGAVPGKGCACPGKTGKPKLSEMAPTWLKPGIKFIYTAKAGDFYISIKRHHNWLLINKSVWSAHIKRAVSREGPALVIVSMYQRFTEKERHHELSGFLTGSRFRTKIVFASRVINLLKMGIFVHTYTHRDAVSTMDFPGSMQDINAQNRYAAFSRREDASWYITGISPVRCYPDPANLVFSLSLARVGSPEVFRWVLKI